MVSAMGTKVRIVSQSERGRLKEGSPLGMEPTTATPIWSSFPK